MKRVWKRNYRRALSALLTFAMTVTNVGLNAGVAFAAGETMPSEFLLEAADLKEAIQEAEESGEKYDFSTLDLSIDSQKIYDSYKELLDGNVYELDVDVDDSYALEGTGLDVLYNADSEKVVFLFINASDMIVEFNAYVDGYMTESVMVNPNAANVEDADASYVEDYSDAVRKDDVAKKAHAEVVAPTTDQEETAAADETDLYIEQTEESSESAESTENTAENIPGGVSPEETITAEETEGTETEVSVETAEATEAQETEAEVESAEVPEEPETEAAAETEKAAEEPEEAPVAEQVGLSKHVLFQVGTNLELPEETTEEITEAETEEETTAEETEEKSEPVETEVTAPETTTAAEITSTEETSAAAEESTEAASEESKEVESTEDIEASVEETTEAAADESTAAAETTESTEAIPTTAEETTEAAGSTDSLLVQESGQLLKNDLDGELTELETLEGKKYHTVTIWDSANAAAYAVDVEDLPEGVKEIEEGYYAVNYSTDPAEGGTVNGAASVAAGEDLYFEVIPEDEYEVVEVTVNGQVLEAVDEAELASASDLDESTYAYVVEAVEEELDILVSLEKTDNILRPAQVIEKEVNGVTITVSAEEGVLPANTDMRVEEVTEQIETAVKEKEASEKAENESVESVLAYDITLLDEAGNELDGSWSKKGSVNVTFTGDRIAAESKTADLVEVKHVDLGSKAAEEVTSVDDIQKIESVGTAKDVSGGYEVDTIGFDAKHFSVYTITFNRVNYGSQTVEFHVVDKERNVINAAVAGQEIIKTITSSTTTYSLLGTASSSLLTAGFAGLAKRIGNAGRRYYYNHAENALNEVITSLRFTTKKTGSTYTTDVLYLLEGAASSSYTSFVKDDEGVSHVYLVYDEINTPKSTFVSGESKWKVERKEIGNTTDDIILECKTMPDEGGENVGIINITIPEGFTEEKINVNITDALNTIWAGQYVPGDSSLRTRIIVNNLSDKTYSYVDGSMKIETYQESLQEGHSNSEYRYASDIEGYALEGYISQATGFDGNAIYSTFGISRVVNSALLDLYGKTSLNKKNYNILWDENLGTTLKNAGYENGIDDLNQYYLDYCNAKYNTNHTLLEQFELSQILASIITPGGNIVRTDGVVCKETNAEVAELGYNLMYNVITGIKGESDSNDALSSNDGMGEFSIGSYMRGYDKYDLLCKKAWGGISHSDSKEMDDGMQFLISGPLMTNPWQNSEFGFEVGFELASTSYKVVHEYYVGDDIDTATLEGIVEGDSINAVIGQAITVADIEKLPTYKGNTYVQKTADTESITCVAGKDNVIYIRYLRKTPEPDPDPTPDPTPTPDPDPTPTPDPDPTPTPETDPTPAPEPAPSNPGDSNHHGGGGSSSGPSNTTSTPAGGPGATTTTITAEDVPLAALPEATGDPLVEIPDEDVPLAALPKTGQENQNGLVLLLSGLMLAALAVTGKKKEEQ